MLFNILNSRVKATAHGNGHQGWRATSYYAAMLSLLSMEKAHIDVGTHWLTRHHIGTWHGGRETLPSPDINGWSASWFCPPPLFDVVGFNHMFYNWFTVTTAHVTIVDGFVYDKCRPYYH